MSQDHAQLIKQALKKVQELKKELAERSQHHRAEPIAVVGASCRLPGKIESTEAFWRALEDAADLSQAIPKDRWDNDAYYDPTPGKVGKIYTKEGYFVDDVYAFDNDFFRISPAEAIALDPQQRLLLEGAWNALENANIDPDTLRGKDVGVYVGIMACDHSALIIEHGAFDLHGGTGNSLNVAAGRISYVLGLQGPAMAVDTACSSSLVAVHLACQALKSGECSAALVGGVNVQLSPKIYAVECAGRMIARDGRCKTFDAAADGYVRGDACVVLMLKRLSDAERDGDRILGVIRGTAVNHDGMSSGLTVPNGKAQIDVMRRALRAAEVTPSDVSYIEAHGTGTELGDPLEMSSIREVYCTTERAQPLVVGSVKTNFGHTEAAAGALGLLKTLLAMRAQKIPAHLNFKTPNPYIPWNQLPVRIPTETCAWEAERSRLAAISSFGVSGTNAHVILEGAPDVAHEPEKDRSVAPLLLALSARSHRDLEAQVARFGERLAELPPEEVAAACYSAGIGRKHFAVRKAFVAGSKAELLEQLERYRSPVEGRERELTQPSRVPAPTAWLLGREGLPRAELLALSTRHSVCREQLAQCQTAIMQAAGVDLTVLLNRAPELPLTPIEAAFVTFASHVTVAKLLESCDMPPAALWLEGQGALAAACVAKVMSLETAAVVLQRSLRGEGQKALDGVELAAAQVPLYDERGARVPAGAAKERAFWTRWLASSQSMNMSQVRSAGFESIVCFDAEPRASVDGLTQIRLEPQGKVPGLSGAQGLSRLYELGFALNFRALFAGGRRPDLTLPSYPFARRELRSEAAKAPVTGADRKKALQSEAPRASKPTSKPTASAVLLTSAELRDKVGAKLVETLCAVLGLELDQVSLTRALSDYGADSLLIKTFAERIGEFYGIDIPASVFFAVDNLDMLRDELFDEFADDLLAGHTGESEGPSTSAAEPATQPKAEAARTDASALAHALSTEPIAIIGMSGRLPQSENLDEFWAHLDAGHDLITPVPKERWDSDSVTRAHGRVPQFGGFISSFDRFDEEFFGIMPGEARGIDPQHRLLLEEVWKAIEDAGYAASSLSGRSIGLFAGVQFGDYERLLEGSEVPAAFAATGNARTMLANRISFLLNLRGPSQTIDTACSSSLVAIHHAIQSLRSGESEMALAGGVNLILSPDTMIVGAAMGMLSEDGRCKTLDKSANGYVKGEGVGVLVLKPLSRALADGDHIHALIRGTAVNHGGKAHSLTAPNPRAQAALLNETYERAGISPLTLSYIELHGTGTDLGDPIEVDAIKRVFRDHAKRPGKTEVVTPRCAIGSVKTNIGHLEPAAGVAGIFKTVLALRHRRIPRTLHLSDLNPMLQLEGTPIVPLREACAWEPHRNAEGHTLPRRAAVSSFGFGGVNAHAVLEEYVPSVSPGVDALADAQVIVLSARNEERLREYVQRLAGFVTSFVTSAASAQALRDFAYTLQVGRVAQPVRLATVVHSFAELHERLLAFLDRGASASDVLFERVDASGTESDASSRKLVEQVLRRKDWEGLADLWVNGLVIDWAELHGPGVKRMALPTYPFAPRRHWFQSPSPRLGRVATSRPEAEKTCQISDGKVRAALEMVLGAEGAALPADQPFELLGVASLARLQIINALVKLEPTLDSARDGDALLMCVSIAELEQFVAKHTSAVPPVAPVDLTELHAAQKRKPQNLAAKSVRGAGDRARGEVVVDESHPFFFDHPLDHVSGIHLAEGLCEVAKTALLAHADLSSVAPLFVSELVLRFPRTCQKEPPAALLAHVSAQLAGEVPAHRIDLSAQQAERTVVSGSMVVSVREAAEHTPVARAAASQRPELDRQRVNKQRGDNVLLSAPEHKTHGAQTSWGAWLTLPSDNHVLVDHPGPWLDAVLLAEAARQCLRALQTPDAAGAPGLSAAIPLLESISVSLTRPVARSEDVFFAADAFDVTAVGSSRRILMRGSLLVDGELVGGFEVAAMLMSAAVLDSFKTPPVHSVPPSAQVAE